MAWITLTLRPPCAAAEAATAARLASRDIVAGMPSIPHGPAASQVPDDFRGLRESYGLNDRLLDPADLAGGWSALLTRWIADAASGGEREPNAMVIATCDVIGGVGYPSTRTVLCKGVSTTGVRFFTTRTSRKGAQLAANPRASATFPLLEAERQVHLEGLVVPLDDVAGREYWATRSRDSQIAAWASAQSQPVAGAPELRELYAEAAARFTGPGGESLPVPMPPYWGGYELRPDRVEFWQGGAGRFHDRLVATREPAGGGGRSARGSGTSGGPGSEGERVLAWRVERLQP
ncbi:Pyridoxine/pyridoxamine 5'-phosphate oxidase [Dietzia timorensis]|uniref:Pyridoxine/pyridoxamine 5'-phosphate oxidase n=2 Tax=Dietzia timorensis TaxID=499555 RepID=A0A173LIC9_9ACTN|nr:Pyridoxine/pyridoxamine 5'-phosphate oxidase [Dietzia timorensis]